MRSILFGNFHVIPMGSNFLAQAPNCELETAKEQLRGLVVKNYVPILMPAAAYIESIDGFILGDHLGFQEVVQ